MGVEFDSAKDRANIAKHGLSLSLAVEFDFETALVTEDTRFDYGETRMIALGYVGARLHVLIYTTRAAAMRPISLRKANDREVRYYEAQV